MSFGFNTSNPMKIYLIGYFGYRNLGDDLMLEALLDQFEASNAVSKVAVDMHEDTLGNWTGKSKPITGTGLEAKAKRLSSLLSCDMLLWGGGTCLYDAGDNSGMRRLLRYAKLAKAFGKKFCMANIGIGRLDSLESRQLAAAILNQADAVTLRDHASHRMAHDIAPLGRYTLGGDLATLYPLPVSNTKASTIKTVSFSGVREAVADKSIVEATAASLRALVSQGAHIKFLPFHGGPHSDHEFHKVVAQGLPEESYTLVKADTAREIVDAMKNTDFHIGMRLHSAVVADLIGLPGIGLVYHPKVGYYLQRQRSDYRAATPSAGFTPDYLNAVLAEYARPDQTLAEERALALHGLRRLVPAG